jgi:hypothetical protein
MPDVPLDNDLVAKILENLRIEPSQHLREMLAQPAGDRWSPEALEAARLLLDQRSKGLAAEPVYRTALTAGRFTQGQAVRDLRTGDGVLAPSFSVPRGFSALVFLGRFLGRAYLYPGRVGEIKGNAAVIYYYNGYRGWVRLVDVRPLTIDVGTRLRCPWRRQAGTVTHTTQGKDPDERVYVRYDDGQGEWLTLNQVVVRSSAREPRPRTSPLPRA